MVIKYFCYKPFYTHFIKICDITLFFKLYYFFKFIKQVHMTIHHDTQLSQTVVVNITKMLLRFFNNNSQNNLKFLIF